MAVILLGASDSPFLHFKEEIPMSKGDLRSAAFNNPPRKRIPFKYNDQDFELLAPTVSKRKFILQKSKSDEPSILDIQIWTCLECTVLPGTTEKVFEETDHETFENMSMNGFLDQAARHCLALMNVDKSAKEASASSKETSTSS